MCGIFGFSRRTERTLALVPFLAWEMESRGRDSWGVTDGRQWKKRLGEITDSWEVPKWGEEGPLLFHTRQASCGAKTVENQHPFRFDTDRGYVVGVHNGCLRNHTELNTKYNRSFDVDSMHIFANIAEGKDTEEICGYGAVMWFEVTDKEGVYSRELFLSRFNMTDIHVIKLKTGEVVWCSYVFPLVKAAKMLGIATDNEYVLADNLRYRIGAGKNEGEDELYVTGKMKWGAQWAGVYGGYGDYNEIINAFTAGWWCNLHNKSYVSCKCTNKDNCVPIEGKITKKKGVSDHAPPWGYDPLSSRYLPYLPKGTNGNGNGKFNPDQIRRIDRGKGLCAGCSIVTVGRNKLICKECMLAMEEKELQGMEVCR